MTDEQLAELDAEVSKQGSAVKAAKDVRLPAVALPTVPVLLK